MAFPKFGVPFFGGPIIRTLVLGGLYWGPPYVGKLPNVNYGYCYCLRGNAEDPDYACPFHGGRRMTQHAGPAANINTRLMCRV